MSDSATITNPTWNEDVAEQQQPVSVDKGKGKARAVEPEVDEDDQDDEGADDDEEEEQDEGFSIDDDEVINAPNLLPLRLVGFADTESLSLESTQLAELIQDEEELAEIDTSNIVWTGRRRNAPLDYSSEEALKQAGLDKSSAAVEQEEDDTEFQGEGMDDE
ncbi:hypothetical protein NDA13_002982 [Ustilago tritici]|nr:hypothetical protein NDA13_002982 [Ustilago tritici]